LGPNNEITGKNTYNYFSPKCGSQSFDMTPEKVVIENSSYYGYSKQFKITTNSARHQNGFCCKTVESIKLQINTHNLEYNHHNMSEEN